MKSENKFSRLALLGIGLLLLICSATAADVSRQLLLENGITLQITEIEYSRILPHAFYDQAMASIANIYPNSQIIAKRRLGLLGKNKQSLYSMVCYKESKDLDEVTISGVITLNTQAWSFDAKVTESSFADTLLLIMEVLAEAF